MAVGGRGGAKPACYRGAASIRRGAIVRPGANLAGGRARRLLWHGQGNRRSHQRRAGGDSPACRNGTGRLRESGTISNTFGSFHPPWCHRGEDDGDGHQNRVVRPHL